jgi:uncharacterized membrane-anchored protein
VTPTITTVASPGTLNVNSMTDVATVTGLVLPVLTGAGAGTVEFRLYGIDDTDCSQQPVTTRLNRPLTLNPDGTHSANSLPAYTPTAAGTYRWRAFYSGDVNNVAVAGDCNAQNENVTVPKVTPTIATVASPGTINAASMTDVATVTGLVNPILTGVGAGTIEFRLYGVGDTDCSQQPVTTRLNRPLTANPDGTHSANSLPAYTPTAAGTYRWRAFYSGDVNNAAVAGDCNAQNENVTVAKATPTIATVASTGTLNSASMTDVATVTGLISPVLTGVGAGTVEFRLYGVGDTDCSQQPVTTRLNRPLTVNPDGTHSANSLPAYTPTVAGTYRWRAFYSGDVNNAAVAGDCNAQNENVTVAKVTPTIATVASPGTINAASMTDVATVTGLVLPILSGPGAGTVEFRLYGVGDTDCSQQPVTTRLNRPLTANPDGTHSADSLPAYTPTAAGTYRWRAFYSGDVNNAAVAGDCNAQNENVTVAKATPTIATVASAGTLNSASMTDVATVTGLVSPVLSGPGAGTIEFRLYGVGDTDCSQQPVTTRLNRPLTANPDGTHSANSLPAYTPTAAGTYRWRAFYSGDVNNAAVAGDCNAQNENVAVAPATPTIETAATSGTLNVASMTDTATVSGLVSPILTGPGAGTVEFRLYGVGDADCSQQAILTRPGRPLTSNGDGTYSASSGAAFTPTTAGTYRWRALYSGDANNAFVNGVCNALNENALVQAVPTIATVASSGALNAATMTDTATVSGLLNPIISGAGAGTVEFRLYGVGDTDCSQQAILTRTGRPLTSNGDGTYSATSGLGFTPTSPGTYRWRAFYSGDANNTAVNAPCNAPNESTSVTQAQPTIATQASGNIVLDAGTLVDTATVSGLVNPIAGAGTVEFRLYRPGDTSCTQEPLLTRSGQPLTLNGDGTATASSGAGYVPTEPGTYRWRAFYSGDANNLSVNGPCNADNESTIVARVTPTITTNASPDIVLGAGTLIDNATVSGRHSPVAGASIIFTLYGPDDAGCTGGAVYTSPAVAYPVEGGSVSSPPFTPTLPGAYRWIATYSGDTNNAPVSGQCNDANELTRVTTPPPPPPAAPPPAPPPPPPPPPVQDVAPVSDVPRGSATISGKTGCQGTPFNVMVAGRQIEKVIFSLDGKVIKTLTRPNSGSRYKLPVNPRTKKTGIHRVLARIIFTTASGTNNRTLRVLFTRCGRKTNLPAFTG